MLGAIPNLATHGHFNKKNIEKMKRIFQILFWAAVMVSPFVLEAQKQDSVRLVDPKDFPSDTTVEDMDETYGRPFSANKKYKMKYIRKYVRQGFGGVVTVNALTGEVNYVDASISWPKLNAAVKDSIRYTKKDTSAVVLSSSINVNTNFADTRRFANVFFIAKGNADTAKVNFDLFPAYNQIKTVFHVVADSGKVALDMGGWQSLSNKRYYVLEPGQRAMITPLYDTYADGILWNVVILNNKGFDDLAQNTGVLYVAPYGNDTQTGAGRVYRPYKTLAAAVAAASSGNVIYVFPGTYYEPSANLWKNGVSWYFDNAEIGETYAVSEGFINNAQFETTGDNQKVVIRGSVRCYQILDIKHKNITFDAEGALVGQVFFSPGANSAKVTIKTHETPTAFFQYMNTADTVTRNTYSLIADVWVPYAKGISIHSPIGYFNNTSTRSKLNNYSLKIGSVHMTQWGDYSNRGIVQCRGVGVAFDSTFLRLDIGKAVFDLVGVNSPAFGLLAFFPFQASTGNQFYFNCDDCLLKNRAVLANSNVMPENTDLTVISGNYRTYNKLDPFFISGGSGGTTNRYVLKGNFYSHDTTLLILGQRANWELEGTFKTREADDLILVADWANSTSKPILRNTIFDSPATTPMTANTATTWYTSNARSMTAITKDADITYLGLPQYDPNDLTGTSRVVPYINTNGRVYTGNDYFKADTNTTSGGQAKLRILINNPTGAVGEGDTYSSLSVRTGDALGSEAIANFGDQAVTQATTGYDAIFQTYRSGGNFTAKSNLTNGVTTGKFQFRGQVNGASRVLGNIYNVYTGDGTTINSQILGTSAVAGSIVAGWKLDETSRFWLGSGADDFYFPTTGPTLINGRIYTQEWATTGSASTPAWKETQYGVFSGTTDASGDISPSFAVMAGQTYAAVVTVEGTTAYQVTVHTKAQNTFKARIFDAATGAAVGAGVNVTISYIVKLP